ncbi:ribosomal protein S6 kinase delta-1 isoform 2 [Camelus ferus]|nr:ribosomal protein S6 kinase delta-1 isoform 2 [Camelus ferus]
MTSPRERGADLARFYTVTEPQRHPRGYTVYKVTARIIVWKRYSDFKKLHKELWQIHKNLFRHSELFPPFAKGIVFGRFDESVIEERRQCAEDLLQFSANIPALYNSKQLEDFFKGGIVNDGSELIGPVEAYSDSLIDSFPECSTEGFSSDSDLVSLTVDVDSLAELDDGMASNQNSPIRTFGLSLSSDSSALGAVASDIEQNKTEEERESQGVQGESSPTRREAVKRRTAEYLMRAESLCSLYVKPQLDDVSQGLRKSSEYSRNRKTIIPRRVPNMVCLHKYIISEESVFLVLQHAEGGKLWSYISKFLNRSPEESFDIEEVKKSTLTKVQLQQPASSPQDSSSFESRGSDGGAMLQVLPLKTSLTPSSQDDSNQDDDGQDSSPKWPDSGSSSEEECTTSYLTLCNEDSPSAQLIAHELKFFPGEDDLEAVSSPRTSDSLSRSKNSPMEFFRIDNGDSTPRSFSPSKSKVEFMSQDTISRGSDDSVPVISFKDAAFDDVSGTDEGRPDLLVNLPGELEPMKDDPKFQGLGVVESAVTANNTEESLLCISDPLSDQTDDLAKEEPTVFQRDSKTTGEKGCIQRWAAEMVVALDALHREGIVCRDLNPNNILLNDRGHIQLTYFSRWSEVEDSCDSDAIERMYCAPEVGAITEETEACDWWSLGAVLFELLTGKLLQFNPVERLGAGVAGVEDIKSHPFFTPVDWAELMR